MSTIDLNPSGMPQFEPLDADIDVVQNKALAELQSLIGAKSVDDAHGAALDRYISYLMAGVYRKVHDTYRKGLAAFDAKDAELIKRTSRQRADAQRRSLDASALEQQADAAYLQCYGTPRPKTPTDWQGSRNGWKDHHLDAQDTAVPVNHNFRRHDGTKDDTEHAPGAGIVDGNSTGITAIDRVDDADDRHDTGKPQVPNDDHRKPYVGPMVFPSSNILLALLGVLGNLADPLLTKATMDTVVNDGSKLLGFLSPSWAIVLALTAISIVLPLLFGRDEAKESLAESDDKRLALHRRGLLFKGAWLAIGLMMFFIRLFEDTISRNTASIDYFRTAPIAGLMIFLFIGSGLSLARQSKDYFMSAFHRVKPILRKAGQARKAADLATADAEQTQRQLDALSSAKSRWEQSYSNQLTVIRNKEAALQELVRLRLAQSLADPSCTATVETPHKGSDVDTDGTTANSHAR